MSKTFRHGKVWPLQLVLAGLIVWLAQGILIQKSEISEAYAAQGQADRKPVIIERPPLRFIKDPNPSFSAVAVDSDSNMLVVSDENLFRIMEYDRRDSTPPQARLTEPKRVISGTNTKAEMICGVYIDPKTKEIYALNGDTQNWMPIFSTDARGNATPSRALNVPGHPFQMAVDEEKQLIYMTIQSDNKIVVYRKQADGAEKPLRTIEGNDTELEDPHGLALDTRNKLIFVSNFGNADLRGAGGRYGKFEPPSITVYPMEASGNVKPVRIIEGPKTLMNWPAHMAFHEERQELFVANDADNSILVFRGSDQGDAAPIRTIKGSKTGIKSPPGIALDSKLGELYVANMGTPSVTVFPVTANGDVAPIRTIRGAAAGTVGLMIGNPGAVGYDSKREQILVPN
jgi:6-phosphogluconolactonase (cycloisomerase 2 family)